MENELNELRDARKRKIRVPKSIIEDAAQCPSLNPLDVEGEWEREWAKTMDLVMAGTISVDEGARRTRLLLQRFEDAAPNAPKLSQFEWDEFRYGKAAEHCICPDRGPNHPDCPVHPHDPASGTKEK
jgi:hypothetical protein